MLSQSSLIRKLEFWTGRKRDGNPTQICCVSRSFYRRGLESAKRNKHALICLLNGRHRPETQGSGHGWLRSCAWLRCRVRGRMLQSCGRWQASGNEVRAESKARVMRVSGD